MPWLSQQLQGRRGTLLGTDAAAGTLAAIDGMAVPGKRQSTFRTDLHAGFTADTAIADPVDLGADGNAFGIVTPGAFKTAALKKSRCTDARTVFGRHALNFQDGCF